MNAIDTLMNVAILTPGDGGPWDGNYDGEWWWWVIRPLTFVLTILFIAFIVRFVVFGGFRRFNGPGAPGGGGRDRYQDRDRDREAEQVQPSQQTSTVETPRVETHVSSGPATSSPSATPAARSTATNIAAASTSSGNDGGPRHQC